ncbi:complex I subunit 4 family protein [Arthrobacter sp. H14-L1]|uniref:complex I subunit 4 family protein n=1 Tax=Arthrobacter sp. H14-L1 TaxID=2996697 RepID=UPI00226EF8A2|nr:NADH-quinone oxidoreductase subunit M [Arthrobacter sp. H14-L1]MCY0904577.1 NADH-quinone oxidoreductase subunit M [Arthrobacter sp. H14-L1]
MTVLSELPVLSMVVFLPVLVGIGLLLVPEARRRLVAGIWITTTAVDLALIVALWIGYAAGGGRSTGAGAVAGASSGTGAIAYETNLAWMPTLGSGYHVGVDGLSLPLAAMTALLFLACAIYSVRQDHRPRTHAALFLFLQTVSLGLFVSLDLILFFVFFDLSIVGMYFIIAVWGHGNAARSALQFFLYTFIGSLALLLGFIVLYLASDPHTFDIVELIRQDPLKNDPLVGGLALLTISIGLAVKTPTVPFHTWLPPAHTDAPAPGSVILAGVLLKMGAFGFVRIAIPILPGPWHSYAMVFVIVGVVSVLYGALVAMAQTNFKRMVAYTSVNHMGYIILGLGAAGLAAGSNPQAANLAVTGAVTQMVSHGLLTGALFLLAGVLFARGHSYEMTEYGGLAGTAPRFAALTAVAVFGSLGLPGLSGFIAEFQIFTGSLGAAPIPTALALLGILITAALLLRMLAQVFLGPERQPKSEASERDAPAAETPYDLRPRELLSVAPLLVLAVVIGVFPRFLLDLIEPAARALIALVAAGTQ